MSQMRWKSTALGLLSSEEESLARAATASLFSSSVHLSRLTGRLLVLTPSLDARICIALTLRSGMILRQPSAPPPGYHVEMTESSHGSHGLPWLNSDRLPARLADKRRIVLAAAVPRSTEAFHLVRQRQQRR